MTVNPKPLADEETLTVESLDDFMDTLTDMEIVEEAKENVQGGQLG